MSKKEFVKNLKKQIKKSYDFENSHVRIDSKDQKSAESVDPKLLDKLNVFIKSEKFSVESLSLGKGLLVLSKSDNNLFNGFYKDLDGQVTEKFANQTIEIIAKTLDVKKLIENDPQIENETQPSIDDEISGSYIKLKFGNFEFEMQKSMTKDLPKLNKQDLHKAINIWKKSSESYTGAFGIKNSLRELTDNWDLHQEKFSQILFGVQQKRNK